MIGRSGLKPVSFSDQLNKIEDTRAATRCPCVQLSLSIFSTYANPVKKLQFSLAIYTQAGTFGEDCSGPPSQKGSVLHEIMNFITRRWLISIKSIPSYHF